jgi:asparagine synthetase B (glutamine-hydrolysing)
VCGIGGIVRYGERPIAPWQVEMLGCSLEYRGNDATGLAVQFKDGSIEVQKDHEPAWRFLSARNNYDWLRRQLERPDHLLVLVHTRKMTKGSQFQNKNNHPMHAGESAIIHNGVISNDDQLFRQLDLERQAETDSDIIRAMVDKWGLERKLVGREGKLTKIIGSVASAAIHPKFPNRLLLLRSNNPLYIGTNQEHMCFASAKRSCFLVLRQWIKRFGIEQTVHDNQLAFISMPNHSGWMLDLAKHELLWHDEFTASSYERKITYNVHNPDWRRRRDESERAYEEAKRNADAQRLRDAGKKEAPLPLANRRPDFVVCPGSDQSGKSCATVVNCRPLPQTRPIWKMKCPECGTNLAEAKPCSADGETIQ